MKPSLAYRDKIMSPERVSENTAFGFYYAIYYAIYYATGGASE